MLQTKLQEVEANDQNDQTDRQEHHVDQMKPRSIPIEDRLRRAEFHERQRRRRQDDHRDAADEQRRFRSRMIGREMFRRAVCFGHARREDWTDV